MNLLNYRYHFIITTDTALSVRFLEDCIVMSIEPKDVHKTLSRYVIVDGLDLVLDLRKSKGCRIYDSKKNRYFLDGFSFGRTYL